MKNWMHVDGTPIEWPCRGPVGYDESCERCGVQEVHHPRADALLSDGEPVPSPFTPEVDGWAVQVIESDGICKTIFSVGVQHFVLAGAGVDEEEREHCEFIRRMFHKALIARDEMIRSRTPAQETISPTFGGVTADEDRAWIDRGCPRSERR